tara:strand:+ start:491 stop:985 length:495 start_codon:yes stop_codon:yes gene_type:complete
METVKWPIIKSSSNVLQDFSNTDINNMDINKCILLLPTEIRNKIGIYCIKEFWRTYIPLTEKIPSYYKMYQKIQNYKLQLLNNIHLLHLDCNTLPENKGYIVGCQCDYCKEYYNDIENYNEINFMELHLITNPQKFNEYQYIKYNNSYIKLINYNLYYNILNSS